MKNNLGVLIGFALAGLNLAVVAFFVLWQIADTAAINRMESASGMDSTRLLPNADLLWLAACASLFLLLCVDGLIILAAVKLASANRKIAADTDDVSTGAPASAHHRP
ncbi:hypothetical protein ACFUTX_00600 [Microbacterium sp. NPDC057407]|uniref:hypothetical protein n=1 Tax=Microbacterium sp. NPDC057407 TaxID=3346120 RepID=UPI00366E4CB4